MSKTFTELIKKYPHMEDDIEELRSSVKEKTNKMVYVFTGMIVISLGIGVILWLM